MNTKETINKKIEELDTKFDNLLTNGNFNINNLENNLEDIMLENLEEYKNILNNHVEDLLSNKIDEKELIIKKNKNGN